MDDRCLGAALELRPNYAEARNNICAGYNKLGRYEEAAAACEQALRYKPDLELARNNLQYARKMARASAKQRSHPFNINCGLRIADCGLAEEKNGRPAARTESRESQRR